MFLPRPLICLFCMRLCEYSCGLEWLRSPRHGHREPVNLSMIFCLGSGSGSILSLGDPVGRLCISLRVVVAIEIAHYGGDSKRNQACLSRLVSASVWYSFILVHHMIVEVSTSVFPLRLGNTEILLLVDAPGQSPEISHFCLIGLYSDMLHNPSGASALPEK